MSSLEDSLDLSLRSQKNEREAENVWVMKIGEISGEGVVVTTRQGTLTRTYGIPMSIESLGHMDDGPNYDYVIIFR